MALLLPACTFAPPLPQAEWDVPFDPLYPPTVWIEADDLRMGGGVVVASDPELGISMLKKQRDDGVDAHSKAVDPLFMDPENGDFRFKPGSPAAAMGIMPIDLSKVGLQY